MTVRVVVVEDDPDDFEAFARAFAKTGLAAEVVHAPDPDSARAKLAEHVDSTVVMLDLSLPGVDGLELLDELKADPRTRTVPIVVLASSSDERTVADAYRRGAAGYFNKPVDFARFERTVAAIAGYWIACATLPGAQP